MFTSEIWCLDLFEYAEFNGGVHFFCFSPKTPVLGKFDPKNENRQFNSMVMFTFTVFYRKYTFLSKFGSKNQYCQFKLKCCT